MNKLARGTAIGLIALSGIAASAASAAEDSAWVSLLNGKDLKDWTPYFAKTGIGNQDSTFKVTKEGWIYVDIHLPFAKTGFGHLFYTKRKFSYYMIRANYRFTSDGYGAPDWSQGWNLQNNGLMVHSQDPGTMKGADFPNSIEVQLLGPKNGASTDWPVGHTLNVCTPGTFIAYNGNANYTQHCTNATYPDAWKKTKIPYEDPDGWTDATVRVLSDSMFQHFTHGTKVFEYTRIRLDNGTPLKEGYLSIQAEGTSTQFKDISVLDLVGCMDKSKPAYRSYFVKNDPAACAVSRIESAAAPRFELVTEGSALRVRGEGASIAEVRRPDGALAEGFAARAGMTSFRPAVPGIYLVSIRTASGSVTRRVPCF